MTLPLTFSDEAAMARAEGRPIVALESTIISHGLPWPKNLEVARQAEEEIRTAGATPATIAVGGGEIRIGLKREQLHELASADDVWKLSRADLPVAL